MVLPMLDLSLTHQEYMDPSRVTLAELQRAVFHALRDRTDVVVIGAHAVNAHVPGHPRMTSDVDVLSTNAEALAEQLRQELRDRFHIALRIRRARHVWRVYRTGAFRFPLVDIQPTKVLPRAVVKGRVRYIAPEELMVLKVLAAADRQHRAKGHQDRADIANLLTQFPSLRTSKRIEAILSASKASPNALAIWEEAKREGRR
jgi:hypothetical protein